jgi:capsid protein
VSSLVFSALLAIYALGDVPLPPVNVTVIVITVRGPIVGPQFNLHYIPPRLVRQSVAGTTLGDKMRAAWADFSKVINAPFSQDEFDVAWGAFQTKYAALKAEFEQQQAATAALEVRATLDAAYKTAP